MDYRWKSKNFAATINIYYIYIHKLLCETCLQKYVTLNLQPSGKRIKKSCFNPFTVSNQHSPDKDANDQAAVLTDLITCLIIVTFVKVKNSNWRWRQVGLREGLLAEIGPAGWEIAIRESNLISDQSCLTRTLVERIKDKISYNRDLVGVIIKDNISLMIHPLQVLRTILPSVR